jgi:hypothetical protein
MEGICEMLGGVDRERGGGEHRCMVMCLRMCVLCVCECESASVSMCVYIYVALPHTCTLTFANT